MKEKNWPDIIGDKLRDMEVTPSEGVWEHLEQDLKVLPAVRTPRWKVLVRVIPAAAAILAAIVVAEFSWFRGFIPYGDEVWVGTLEGYESDRRISATTILSESDSEADSREREERASSLNSLSEQLLAVRSAADSDPDLSGGKPVRRPSTKDSAFDDGKQPGKKNQIPDNMISSEPDAECDLTLNPDYAEGIAPRPAHRDPKGATTGTTSSSRDSVKSDKQSVGKTSQYDRRGVSRKSFDRDYVAVVRPSRPLSMAVYAQGGLSSSSKMGVKTRWFNKLVEQSNATISDSNGETPSPFVNLDTKDASCVHHQPLSFGLTLRKSLGGGFSLESGLCYTLLRSDVTLPVASRSFDQTLHFVGIPLRANWNFLDRRRVAMYVGTGFGMEFCVDAHCGNSRISEPGAFWSTMGVAGIEYRPSKLVGLYFEPEVAYYFNQTRVRTSRTDSPATFTLRLGLRFNL